MKIKSTILALIIVLLNNVLFAQNSENKELGLEAQWYPAGWLLGPVFQYHSKPKHVFFGKLGINLANRHDWSGLNDNEVGKGYGGSLGYRYFLKKSGSSPFIGTRGEFYNTFIDWKNDIGSSTETKGRTQIIVYQPSLEVGCWLKSKSTPWSLTISGGIGKEINIKTKGKAVGEGGMWLGTFTILRRVGSK